MSKASEGGKSVSTYVPGYTDDFGQRLGLLIDSVGTLRKAGEVAGVTDEQLARWRDGASKPNLFGIERLAKAAGKSLDWVMYGSVGPADGAKTSSTVMPNLTFIERLDVEASAGNGTLVDNEQALDFVAFQTRWLRRKGINPAAVRLLNIRGDSMEPTIRNGDIALVDTSIRDIIDNAIYVLVVGNRLLIKRIHILMSGALRLISDNALYPHEDVPASEAEFVRVSGRVVWFGRSI